MINGRKAWASHLAGWDGDGPDVMTIVCRTPGGVSLIVAEREHLAGRIEVEEYYDLPGLRGCLTTRVRLQRRARPAGEPARRGGAGRRAHPERVLRQRRLDRHLRRRGDAAGLRRRLPLRARPRPAAGGADHRAPGRGRRPRRRQGQDRGGPAAGLAGAGRRDVACTQRPGTGPARQGLRLGDRRRGHQRLIQVVGVTAYDERFPLVRSPAATRWPTPSSRAATSASAAASSRTCSARPATTRWRPPAWPEPATRPWRGRPAWSRRRRRGRRP